MWLDRGLPVEQQVDELLGEQISNGFTADEYSIEHRAGIHVEEHIGVDIRGEFTAGRRTAQDLDDGGSSWPDELVAVPTRARAATPSMVSAPYPASASRSVVAVRMAACARALRRLADPTAAAGRTGTPSLMAAVTSSYDSYTKRYVTS